MSWKADIDEIHRRRKLAEACGGDDIHEADINPLIVSAAGALAVDARFVLT